MRAEVGDDVLLITPGVRPAGAAPDDQARVATPEEALRSGADLLVIGRPITGAADPGAAAAAIAPRCGGPRRCAARPGCPSRTADRIAAMLANARAPSAALRAGHGLATGSGRPRR